MNGNLQFLKERLTKEKSERDFLISQIKEKKVFLEDNLKEQDKLLKARALVQIVAEETQKQIEFHINTLVTKALQSVFNCPYEFKMQFVQRRNKTECDFMLMNNGKDCYSFKGGIKDVCNFAIVVATWSLKRTRKLLILDEPFRFLSIDLQNKCSEMMKQLSEKLGIQIIMISHLPNIITSCDKTINIVNVKGVSIVKET